VGAPVLHDAAGLTIASAIAIPGLPPATSARPPDIRIHVESKPAWTDVPFHTIHASPYHTEHGRPIVTVGRADAGFHLDYADGTHIWVDPAGTEVWCMSAPGATLADTATYLIGPVLGFALRRRGALALHASGVVVDGEAMLMVGPHAAGKSTTAAAFTARGCGLVADDVTHLRCGQDGWLAARYQTGIRLWPDAVALLLGDGADLPRATPTWNKRVMTVMAPADVVPPAVRVRSIVFLDPREAGSQAPRLTVVGKAEAVVRLATHSSASHLLDEELRKAEFTALGDLVQQVTCVSAVPSSDAGRLQTLVDLLLRWSGEMRGQDGR
jgi:hypothetical protein